MSVSTQKTIVFITGANGGIGFELASQLLLDPSRHVIIGCRSAEKGKVALKDLQSRNLPGTVELVQLDVTSEESIAAAAKSVEAKHGRLDALVNNAAVAEPEGSPALKSRLCFQTNATGPMLMVAAFAHLLKKSVGTPRIVNISSAAGSITDRLNPASRYYTAEFTYYRASKAALNMLTACQAVEYGPSNFKIFAFCPGYTASNLTVLNRHGGKPTSQGATPVVRILNGERDQGHGKFLHESGEYSCRVQ